MANVDCSCPATTPIKCLTRGVPSGSRATRILPRGLVGRLARLLHDEPLAAIVDHPLVPEILVARHDHEPRGMGADSLVVRSGHGQPLGALRPRALAEELGIDVEPLRELLDALV